MSGMTSRERRLQQMAQKGYLDLTPSERETRLRDSLDELKVFFASLGSKSNRSSEQKEADDQSYE